MLDGLGFLFLLDCTKLISRPSLSAKLSGNLGIHFCNPQSLSGSAFSFPFHLLPIFFSLVVPFAHSNSLFLFTQKHIHTYTYQHHHHHHTCTTHSGGLLLYMHKTISAFTTATSTANTNCFPSPERMRHEESKGRRRQDTHSDARF